MRIVLDIGAITWMVLLCIAIALWVLELPEVPGTFGTIFHHYNPLAIPATFFFFYVLWHMAKARRWGWLGSSLLFAPVTFLGYYWLHVRAQFAPHVAQQAVQGDGPASGGSAP